MPLAKVKTNRQLTLPKKLCDELGILEGDMVNVDRHQGEIIIRTTRVITDSSASKLSAKEQRALIRAKKKLEAIKADMINSKGLTKDETDVAAKVGLIAEDQKWWWVEEWQKKEREAEEDDREGRYTEYDNAEDFINSLPT